MILYVGRCRRCAFQTHSLFCKDFKKSIADHLSRSHHESYGYDYDDYDYDPEHPKPRLRVAVSQLPLEAFRDTFLITVFKPKRNDLEGQHQIQMLISVFKNRGYWKAIRSHTLNFRIYLYLV
jgi:hypothetical protein